MRPDDRRRLEPPPELGDREGALVYVSLGSLGSGDVPLMKQLVAALAATPHRYVVSKGPQHDEYEFAYNMVGEEFLPQVSVLPHVDLVITHAGNNTTTESLHFGKPMIPLPIFWDQHDNAQRMDETGFGSRLPTYSFDRRDLWESIDRLLADSDLRDRLATTSERLQASPGNERAAELIERVAVSVSRSPARPRAAWPRELDSAADRARRGISGALSPAIRSSRAEFPFEGLRLSGPVRRTEASMAGSRAVSAREPGQIREEAALSDTAHAPWASLAGAKISGHARELDSRRVHGPFLRERPALPPLGPSQGRSADILRERRGEVGARVYPFAESGSRPQWPRPRRRRSPSSASR